jgi:hypothetical protein
MMTASAAADQSKPNPTAIAIIVLAATIMRNILIIAASDRHEIDINAAMFAIIANHPATS